MAEGRMLVRRIAENEELATVSPWAEILFYRCIPHLDVEGRITGNPVLLKSKVAPLRVEITAENIENYLAELEKAGLLVRYEVDGVRVIWFPGFSKSQSGLRKEREAPSRLPAPRRVRKDRRSNSGPTPDLLRSNSRIKEVKGKGRGKPRGVTPELPPGGGGWPARVAQVFAREVGVFSVGRIGKALAEAARQLGEDNLVRAAEYYARHPELDKPSFRTPESFAQKAAWCLKQVAPLSPEEAETFARTGQ